MQVFSRNIFLGGSAFSTCQKFVTMRQNMDVRNTAFTEITRTLQILPKRLVNLAIIKVKFNRS